MGQNALGDPGGGGLSGVSAGVNDDELGFEMFVGDVDAFVAEKVSESAFEESLLLWLTLRGLGFVESEEFSGYLELFFEEEVLFHQ